MTVSRAPLLADLLASTAYAMDIFKADEIAALEVRLFEKRGKPYLTD
ncbi:MAG: hypothetical protein ACYDBJ_09040 [Aggregatilineales bacterium]